MLLDQTETHASTAPSPLLDVEGITGDTQPNYLFQKIVYTEEHRPMEKQLDLNHQYTYNVMIRPVQMQIPSIKRLTSHHTGQSSVVEKL